MPRLILVLVVLLGTGLALAQEDRASTSLAPPDGKPAAVPATFGKLPLYFVENRGLYPEEVKYYIQGVDKTLFFAPDGITFRLQGEDQAWAVKLDFVGANPEVAPRGEDRQQAVFSYFKGAKKDWKTGLKTFSTVVYPELWPGIDLLYSGTVNQLKYQFLVQPGADPAKIRLRYRGAESLAITEAGTLRVSTPPGSFEDAAPVAWQEIDGKRVPVEMAYRLDADAADEDAQFGFDLGDYDSAHPLVLDPAVLVYCGYIGGSLDDVSYGVTVDAAGNAYMTGSSQSAEQTFPVTVGPDLTYNGGTYDAYIAKVNPQGTALVYCGYIGGNGDEYSRGLAVDAAGNVYMTGQTNSSAQTFPVTVGPGSTFGGGTWDAFVAKVNPQGTALIYCGYIGGVGTDYGWGLAVDAAGNAYVAGSTLSLEQNFPVTVGPDLTHNGGTYDAFVAKVNAVGNGLVYCGYIGGSGIDRGRGITLDAAGNAYVTGWTNSTEQSFPVAVGPDLTHNGGDDAFVAKVNAAGTALIYCGYIGGSGTDQGYGIALDATGNACIAGRADSTEQSFPVAVGPDLTHNGGYDAFVAKVNPQGIGLAYCGYIGGLGTDYGWDLAVDSLGNAYVVGYTQSTEQTFPVTVGPDLTHNGGDDAFVAKVNAAGTALIYCGYIGGSSTDYGLAVAVDAAGNACVTGRADSTEQTFPVTVGPDLSYNGGSRDAFVAKVPGTFLTGGGSPNPGGLVTLSLSALGDAGLIYQLGSSFGSGPIAIDTRRLELSPDALLFLTVLSAPPGIFQNYAGVLDAQGQAKAAIKIPNLPSLKGIRIYTAFVTLQATAPSGVANISNTFLFSIQ